MIENPLFSAAVARRLGGMYQVEMGSLWWVRERQWQKVLPSHIFARERKKDKHPALSICLGDHAPAAVERIPVLFGTRNKNNNAVVAHGISHELGPHQATYFLHFSRARFSFDTFQQEDLIDGPEELPPIAPNRHKPRLNDDEMENLKNFLKRKDLL